MMMIVHLVSKTVQAIKILPTIKILIIASVSMDSQGKTRVIKHYLVKMSAKILRTPNGISQFKNVNAYRDM